MGHKKTLIPKPSFEMQEAANKLVRATYPQGDNYYAGPIKNGRWLIGYTNDNSLQHGNGESCIVPERLIEHYGKVLASREFWRES